MQGRKGIAWFRVECLFHLTQGTILQCPYAELNSWEGGLLNLQRPFALKEMKCLARFTRVFRSYSDLKSD